MDEVCITAHGLTCVVHSHAVGFITAQRLDTVSHGADTRREATQRAPRSDHEHMGCYFLFKTAFIAYPDSPFSSWFLPCHACVPSARIQP